MGNARYGVHKPLEDEANRLLKESMAGITSQAAKRDILTPWKEKDRKDREIMVESGAPDSSTRRGMFHRVYNPASPHLNSREGTAVRGRRTNSSLRTFVQENGSTNDNDHGMD